MKRSTDRTVLSIVTTKACVTEICKLTQSLGNVFINF